MGTVIPYLTECQHVSHNPCHSQHWLLFIIPSRMNILWTCSSWGPIKDPHIPHEEVQIYVAINTNAGISRTFKEQICPNIVITLERVHLIYFLLWNEIKIDGDVEDCVKDSVSVSVLRGLLHFHLCVSISSNENIFKQDIKIFPQRLKKRICPFFRNKTLIE